MRRKRAEEIESWLSDLIKNTSIRVVLRAPGRQRDFSKVKYLRHYAKDPLLIDVASWMARYQNASTVQSLGQCLAIAAKKSNNCEAFVNRVDKILRMNQASVMLALPGVLNRMQCVNYAEVLYFLDGWDSMDKWAQKKLATDFYFNLEKQGE